MKNPPDAGPDRPRPLAYWAMAGAFAALSLIMLAIPFTRDQGICGYVGWVWLNGGVPYRDAFDGKGPVFYAIYALGLFISRGAEWGVNLLDILSRTAGLLLAGRVTARAAGERAGLFGAALAGLPLFGIFNFMWWNAHPETFMLPMLAGSSLLVLRGGRRNLVGAGALCALAVLCKPTAALHLWLLPWVLASGSAHRDRLANAGFFLLGVALGAGPVLIYFAAVGALGPLWEVTVVFNLLYRTKLFGEGDIPPLSGFWLVFWFLPLLAAGLAGSERGERRRGALFLAVWLVESLVQVVGQGKFFVYHWVAVAPAMGAAAGAGLAVLERRLARPAGPVWARRVVYALLLFTSLGYARNYWTLEEMIGVRRWLSNSITDSEYYGNFNNPGFCLADNLSAAQLAREHTDPDDAVLVFSCDPLINLLSRRVSPTRFIQVMPLTFEPASEAAARMRQRWRKEFMASLELRPPALVFIGDQDPNPLIPITSWEAAQRFPDFWNWLVQNYQPAGNVGDFHLFRKKPRP